MEGVLYKWTNYYNGWQPRWFVLDGGVLSYYDHKEDVRKGSKGSLKMAVCEIQVCPSDDSRLELVIPGEQHFYLRATSAAERQCWVVALGSAKACLTDSRTRKEKEIMEASDSLCSKMSEMRLYYDLMTQQVSLIRQGIQEPRPDVQRMSEASSLLSATCDTFVRALEECVHTAASSVRPSTQQQQQQLAPPALMPPTPRSPQRPARGKSQARASHAESTARSLPRPPPSSRKREPSNKSGRTSSSSSRRRLAMASTRVGAIVEEVEEEAVEASTAEGASRPEPTAAGPWEPTSLEAAASGVAPDGESHRVDTPQEPTSHDADTPQQPASHDADTPQQPASHDADTQQQAASHDADTQQAASHDADTQQAASHDADTQQAASHDADTQQQAASHDADTQQQAASHDADVPQQAASHDADTQQQAASHDADAPQQAASHDADAPQQATTPREAIAGSDVCPRFEPSDVSTQESRRPGEHQRDREDSTVDDDDPNADAADAADDADSINDGHFDDADDGDDGEVGTAGRGEEGGAGENSDVGRVADRGFDPEKLGEGEDPGGEGEERQGEDPGGDGEDGGGEDLQGETVETFFGVMAQRFSDAELQDEQGIHVEPFLRACSSIVPVLDKLGPTAFAPVKLDFVGNIRKITQKYETDPAAFPTLQSIVGHELSSGTALVRNSTTEALLWLRRGLKFLLELLTEVREGQANLHVALSNAYGRTLRRYHGWVVRGVFALALRAAPALDGFLAALTAREGDPTGPEFRRQLNRDLDTYLGAMRAQLGALDELYEQNQLESDRVV